MRKNIVLNNTGKKYIRGRKKNISNKKIKCTFQKLPQMEKN